MKLKETLDIFLYSKVGISIYAQDGFLVDDSSLNEIKYRSFEEKFKDEEIDFIDIINSKEEDRDIEAIVNIFLPLKIEYYTEEKEVLKKYWVEKEAVHIHKYLITARSEREALMILNGKLETEKSSHIKEKVFQIFKEWNSDEKTNIYERERG